MMQRLVIHVFAYFLCAGSLIADTAAQDRVAPSETLIRNATIITITRGTVPNSDLLIRNG